MLADLHVHSYYSDGAHSPEHMAVTSTADVIALADHDTVLGVPEFLQAAASAGKRAIPAVEISTFFGEELHILGYNIDIGNQALLDAFRLINKHRNARNMIMLDKLAQHGMPLDMDEVTFNARSTVNRYHIGLAMVKRGYVKSFKEANELYIGNGKCCFSPNFNLDVKDGIDVIKTAGGVAVLAHPSRYAAKGRELGLLIDKLVSFGIDGIEVYYPAHSRILIETLNSIAKTHNLIATSGSDKHGGTRDNDYVHSLNALTKEVLMI